MFCCVSRRFRKQLVYVMVRIHAKWIQQVSDKFSNKNQIVPGSETGFDDSYGRPNVTITDIALQHL